jgi:hypothetical protein
MAEAFFQCDELLEAGMDCDHIVEAMVDKLQQIGEDK